MLVSGLLLMRNWLNSLFLTEAALSSTEQQQEVRHRNGIEHAVSFQNKTTYAYSRKKKSRIYDQINKIGANQQCTEGKMLHF